MTHFGTAQCVFSWLRKLQAEAQRRVCIRWYPTSIYPGYADHCAPQSLLGSHLKEINQPVYKYSILHSPAPFPTNLPSAVWINWVIHLRSKWSQMFIVGMIYNKNIAPNRFPFAGFRSLCRQLTVGAYDKRVGSTSIVLQQNIPHLILLMAEILHHLGCMKP